MVKMIAQDRAKWSCLIRKGADDYEAERLCEAEIKCKELPKYEPSRY